VFGRPEVTQPLVQEIRTRVASMGLEAELGEAQRITGFSGPLPSDQGNSPALGMAARHMLGYPHGFEFLPPKVSAWPQAFARFSSRRLLWGCGAAATAILLITAVFFLQYWKLSSLQSKWRIIEPKVAELEGLQQQIRKFGPWFDDSHRALRILRKITEAFPEDGVVTTKILEIKDLSVVTCSGVARNDQALLKMMDQLRAAKEVSDLKIDQVRGTPLQFSINFRWVEGRGHED
jgi:hypothetical protein